MFQFLLIFAITSFAYLFPQSDQIQDFKITGADFEGSEILQLYDNQLVWLSLAGDYEDLLSPDVHVDNWKPISVDMHAGDVPENWDGIGWFITTIQVDSSLIGKEMGIQGRIYGAMEVYLNGERIGQAGNVGTSPETEESIGYFEPIVFTFDEQENQHFAIRYSNQNYRKGWNVAPSGLLLTMGYAQDIEDIYRDRREEFEQATMLNILQMGFFIALALLHFILFYYYPTERANLIYGVLLLCVFFSSYYSTSLAHTYNPEQFIRYVTGETFFVILFSIINLYFVYEVTKRKINWLPIAYTVLSLPILYIVFTNPLASRQVGLPFFYASLLIAIFLFAISRIKKKRKGLNVIILTYTLFFILILPRTFWATFNFDFLWAQSYFIYAFSEFLIPIGYSVFLAKRVATTNRNLKQKLTENEKLTEEKLKIEQEKQQLVNRQKQKLEKEVTARTADLQKSLESLTAAQDQLVQQEKLASLGQLTAGIAHEIKNPLNFVTNFSEVSLEMIEEARDEIRDLRQGREETPLSRGESEGGAGARGVSDEAENEVLPRKSEIVSSSVNTPLNPLSRGEAGPSPQIDLILEILDDIEANLRKIHEHGSRADGIVKSMLQHSRSGDGKPEPTQLNPLIKEYVNLAFHGMRAGADPINVEISLQLNENICKVPLVAEDFSRVILNLCNNAFDAMREKMTGDGGPETGYKSPFEGESERSEQGDDSSIGYKPKLTVRTHQTENNVIIEIEDNGAGIPDDIKGKILQPFFTTKKGTQGTGLGLSITNDIVKAHGGKLEIESDNSGSVFSIKIKY